MLNGPRIIRGIIRARLSHPTPVYCQWDITHRCNFRCSFCNVMKIKSAWTPELNTKEALSLIDQLAGLGVAILNISGGEPLLREDLGIILAHAKKKGINTFVATNGWFLEEKVGLLKDAYAVRVSIDGKAEFHDRLRTKGSYQRALNGIRALLKNKKRVAINSVINSQTPYEQIIGLCELAKSLGIQISFSACGVSLGAKKNPTMAQISKEVKALQVEDEWFYQTMEKIRKRYARIVADPALYHRMLKQGGLAKVGCKSLIISVDIKPDGSIVMPCGSWPVDSIKGDLTKIWGSKELQLARKKVGRYDFCRNCRIKCMLFPSMLLNPRYLIELVLSYRV